MDEKKYDKIQRVKDRLYVSRNNLGKAGEHLVAGKLLLNGFNVYSGAIDDGIDLVARKRKKFYHIQVKTCQTLGYDSGKFMAKINLSSLSKTPIKQTFIVFVLHYLGPTGSIDFMGDQNRYDQQYIVLPVQTLFDFLKKNSGSAVVYLFNSLVMEYSGEMNWIIKLRFKSKDLILDNYLFDTFWQIEI